LQRVREAIDGGDGGADSIDGSGSSRGGRWTRQTEHWCCGWVLAGEWNFAIDGSGMVDDFSKADL
jgi:hypothetical protein